MMRVIAIAAAVAASLAAGTLPASTYSCAQWCGTYHCRNTEPRRVCMNRCTAACRWIVSRRQSHGHDRGRDGLPASPEIGQ